MQIQGISSMSGMQQMQQSSSDPLTEDQQSALEEILASYDMESLTEEEFADINSQMDDAGIPRSRETMETMTAAGLDFSTMAPPSGAPQGPPPSGGMMETDETYSLSGLTGTTEEGTTLMDLISQLQSGEASEEDVQSYVSQLKLAISSSVGNMIDQYI